MLDKFGRNIDYLRISITDRCNLRCTYCMPQETEYTESSRVLSYEEYLRVCRLAVSLGITKFKITGGEPLVRKDAVFFIRALCAMDGVQEVTLTTNGLLLDEHLDEIYDAGVRSVNISIDTMDEVLYRKLSGCDVNGPEKLLPLLMRCTEKGMRVKVNTVLLRENQPGIPELISLAEFLPVDVRLIELMPLGCGKNYERVTPDEVLRTVREYYPDLIPVQEKRGNGPARYYASSALMGRIGVIDAVSHRFCENCNRIRLTSTGLLKPCLCYDSSLDLSVPLRNDGSDEELLALIKECINAKPEAHCFQSDVDITELKRMNQIGG